MQRPDDTSVTTAREGQVVHHGRWRPVTAAPRGMPPFKPYRWRDPARRRDPQLAGLYDGDEEATCRATS